METDEFTRDERIAYFSMEVALRSQIPTYSGGLGILAGDVMRTAADLELPLVTVTLVSRLGYFRQEIDDHGRQHEFPDPWEPARWAQPLLAKVAVPIGGRNVWVGGWLYVHESQAKARQPVILLDTHLDENQGADREITDRLYGGDRVYRLEQEIVLGIGGVRMLHALGFRVRQYHLNEGHSALLALELLRSCAFPQADVRPGESPYDIPRVRSLCNFTTHTPVEAGHDRFGYDLVGRLLGNFVPLETLQALAGHDELNMTQLALSMSEYVNGVAERHAETSRRMFPGYKVRAITNGVHPFTWTSSGFRRLYSQNVRGWCFEPEHLVRADRIANEGLWAAHTEAKRELIAVVKRLTGVILDPEACLIGFARRMTAYKRPYLIFQDPERLRHLAEQRPLQIVMAGKAHPRDEGGKRLIEQLNGQIRALAGRISAAYLPGYDMDLALRLVSGSDLWLNTPQAPMEASGTSGMKAALNGVPSLSVLDGWWLEGCIEGVTGWAVGGDGSSSDDEDAALLYDKLESVILPLFYDDRPRWIAVMKGAIVKNATIFNSHHMMRRYASAAYLR